MRLKRLSLFLAVFAVIGVMAAELPCVVTQVDGNLFPSGSVVVVYAMSGRVNCPEPPVVEISEKSFMLYSFVRFVLDRWSDGEWKQFGDQFSARVPAGIYSRAGIAELAGLMDGRYRLIAASGNHFLEAIHFAAGGTGENAITMLLAPSRSDLRVPYLHSARVAVSGYLFFRGHLGGRVASGYLYQLRKGFTEILPAEFEQVDPQDTSVFVNQSFLRGGTLDLPWVRVRLPNNSLDPSRPVYASVTADGGGITVQGVVYDPTDPAAHYTGGFGGEYRLNSR